MKIERLRLLREKTGLSQTAAAKKMGIVRTTYSNYESGNREPDLDTVMKMADFFNVSVDYLIDRNEKSQEITERTATYLTKNYDKLLDEISKEFNLDLHNEEDKKKLMEALHIVIKIHGALK